MSDIDQAMRWSDLSREDKVRWLQCAATPEEIDSDLMSTDRSVWRQPESPLSAMRGTLTEKRTKAATGSKSIHSQK
jgi:hypothetical protein